MVVNRKQPVVPAPPISRTASSQPAPTRRHIRNSKATPRGDQKSNGHRFTPLGSLTSTKLEKKRKSKTSIDFLILFLLSAFTCYSFYLCRPNPLFSSPTYESQPSLCRGLATYRTHVLEPYILPPIKQTLYYGHQISGPYVEEAQVRLSPYFKPATIVIDSFTPRAKSFIASSKSLWKNTVTPIYTQNLRPYYETAVVPRFNRYIKPLLVPLQTKAQKLFASYVLNPICSRTNFFLHALHQFYTLQVDPYVRNARPYAHRFLDMIRAVGVNLSALYTTYLHPSLLKVWNAIHPTICTAWKHFFKLFTEGIYTNVKWVTREVGAYRRQYVDRHVYRILEQVADPKVNGNVKEADNGSSLVVGTRIPSETQELTVNADPLESGPPSSSSLPFSTTNQMDSSTSMPKVRVTNNPETGTPVPSPHESEIEAAMTVAEKSAEYASTVIHELQEEFTTLIVSNIPSTPMPLIPPSASVDEVSPTMDTPVTAEPTPISNPDSDPDLEEFLRELGVGKQADTVPSTPDGPNETADDVDVLASVRPKSKEELLAETAAKRADIVGRHEKWFERLDAGVQETGNGLVRTLQSLRDVSAEDIRRLKTRSKVDPNEESLKDTRSLIWLEQNGEKLIKGLEVYLRIAEARCNDWKIPKDSSDDSVKKLKQDTASKEKEMFLDIVSKVGGKFSSHVDDTRSEVHNWYVDLKEREAEEVLRASRVIKDLALRAQADIAMDYAWLDDVTYLDWQKYHDLMRVYEGFDIIVRQIANGTSTDPIPPSDPVVGALDELDRDLQDIVLGFNYALSGKRSHGLKVFSSRSLDDEGNDDDDDNGFFVVRDNERRVVDLRGVDLGEVELKKETVGTISIKQDGDKIEGGEDSVGILPVPDSHRPGDSESGFDASKIIIGKDKVQIEEALRDIPLEPAAHRHAEL